MKTLHYAECPICQKNWKTPTEEDALELESVLSQAPMYGVLYPEGSPVWLYGTKECTILETRLLMCALHRDGTYAHTLAYQVRRESDGKEYEYNWDDLLPVPLSDVEPVQRGRRRYEVNRFNYWKYFPEKVGYH